MDEAKQSQPSMSASYQGSVRDVIFFTWFHLMRSPGLVAIDLAGAGYITWIGCSSLGGESGATIVIVVCVLFFIIAFSALFLAGFAFGALRALFVRDKTFLAENTIELYDDHFVARNCYGTSELQWTIVHKLLRTRRYIVLSLAPDKAILIPRRAFASYQEWDLFYAFIGSHCEESALR